MLQNRYGNVGPAALKTQRPITSDDEHRVLKFRPRTSAQPPGQPTPQNSAHEADDLSHFERARDEPDDFRHRMLANLAAFAFTVALTAIGIWLAVSATVKANAARLASMRWRKSSGSPRARSKRDRSSASCPGFCGWGFPGGCAEVRGRNLSTRCSSSEGMGRWVFTADGVRRFRSGCVARRLRLSQLMLTRQPLGSVAAAFCRGNRHGIM